MMIRECLAHQLPEPAFVQRGGEFTMTLWRDWLTEELLASYGLNDRQMKAMAAIRQKSSLSTMDYQALTGAARSTAKRDLEDLVGRGVLLLRGSGRGAFYELSKKRPINGPNGPSVTLGKNGPQMAHEPEGVIKPFTDKGSQRAQIVQAHVPAQVGTKSGLSRDQVIEHDARQVTAQVTAQVGTESNVIKDKALQELAETLGTPAAQVTAQVTAQVALFCREPRGAKELMDHLGLRHWKTFQLNYLLPLIAGGVLERTIPDKPTSRFQKYRLTEKGRAWLAKARKGKEKPS